MADFYCCKATDLSPETLLEQGSSTGRRQLLKIFPSENRERKRRSLSQPAITCSKLTIETLEQGVEYVQS